MVKPDTQDFARLLRHHPFPTGWLSHRDVPAPLQSNGTHSEWWIRYLTPIHNYRQAIVDYYVVNPLRLSHFNPEAPEQLDFQVLAQLCKRIIILPRTPGTYNTVAVRFSITQIIYELYRKESSRAPREPVRD